MYVRHLHNMDSLVRVKQSEVEASCIIITGILAQSPLTLCASLCIL